MGRGYNGRAWALEENSAWTVEMSRTDSQALLTKWVFKTKTEEDGKIERYRAKLVVCWNEKLFNCNYKITFAAVMELSTVKLVLVFVREWCVPARHGDISNAYVKANKGVHSEIYLRVTQDIESAQKICGSRVRRSRAKLVCV